MSWTYVHQVIILSEYSNEVLTCIWKNKQGYAKEKWRAPKKWSEGGRTREKMEGLPITNELGTPVRTDHDARWAVPAGPRVRWVVWV